MFPCSHFKFLPFLYCLFISITCFAQQTIAPQDEFLYKEDYNAINTKLYREHIPLDGNEVSIIPFRKDSLYGFVSKKNGDWVIEPKFSQVFAVYAEGAIVEQTDRGKGIDGYGLIDNNGQFLIQPVFTNLFKEGDIYHGLISGVDTSLPSSYSGFIANYYFDKKGKYLFHAHAHRFQSFENTDSLAWFRYGRKYMVYNRKGKLLKEFAYAPDRNFIGIFNNVLVEQLNAHKENASYQGRNIYGKEIFNIPSTDYADAVYKMSEDVYAFISEDGFILKHKNGKDYPYGISNGWYGIGFRHLFSYFNNLDYIPVQNFQTNKTGYINKSGKLVIPCIYAYAGPFENGRAPYYDTAKRAIGFMDTMQRTVIPPVLDYANIDKSSISGQLLHFSDGLCRIQLLIPVKDEHGEMVLQTDERNELIYRTAYIDKSGTEQLLLPDSFRVAGDFHDGLAFVVSSKGQLGFIDKKGKVVIPMIYSLAVVGAYPFPQIVYPDFKNGYVYIKAYKGYIDKNGKPYFSGKQVIDKYDFSH